MHSLMRSDGPAREENILWCVLTVPQETGVGDVVSKFDTYMPVRGVSEVSFCSFLDQLARKLDGSRITVKIC